ncbi:hypothetical protein [Macrococcoides bohemicum]|uniref:hypothetical protein n=1 Tax=Macrococcoides bohemicum TaxID=1903056 RepID=UPI00165DF2BB|nr:hypothetical protein [Macrococcus bohemicus]MBC9875548.1 hypothetical protein [Macrococcus bohemicus]
MVEIIQTSDLLKSVYKNKKNNIPKKKRLRKKWMKKNRKSYLMYAPMGTGVSQFENMTETEKAELLKSLRF